MGYASSRCTALRTSTTFSSGTAIKVVDVKHDAVGLVVLVGIVRRLQPLRQKVEVSADRRDDTEMFLTIYGPAPFEKALSKRRTSSRIFKCLFQLKCL